MTSVHWKYPRRARCLAAFALVALAGPIFFQAASAKTIYVQCYDSEGKAKDSKYIIDLTNNTVKETNGVIEHNVRINKNAIDWDFTPKAGDADMVIEGGAFHYHLDRTTGVLKTSGMVQLLQGGRHHAVRSNLTYTCKKVGAPGI